MCAGAADLFWPARLKLTRAGQQQAFTTSEQNKYEGLTPGLATSHQASIHAMFMLLVDFDVWTLSWQAFPTAGLAAILALQQS